MVTPGRIDPKPFVYLALGLAVWWVLPVGVRALFRETFYEFQAPALLAQSQAQDLQHYWEKTKLHSNRELLEAGRDLARINAAQEIRLQQLQRLAAENRRLEALLDVPSRVEFRTLIARVARRDLNTWWQQIILSKGRADGVKAGSPVVINTGVVGRVVRVHHATCEVELISSPNFRISSNLDGDERPAVFQGGDNRPFHKPFGRITYLPADYAVPNPANGGIQVFTSGVGGVFMGGIRLGVVSGNFTPTSDGMFLEAKVELHTDLARIEEAAILVPVNPEQWDKVQ